MKAFQSAALFIAAVLPVGALQLPGLPPFRKPTRLRSRTPVACADRDTVPTPDVSLAARDVAAALGGRITVPRVPHLRDWLPDAERLSTPYHGGCMVDVQTLEQDECVVPQPDHGAFVSDDSVVLADPVVSAAAGAAPEGGVSAYMQGGPREHVYFTSDEIVAAVVTCGGLCPGLNTVVRELVSCLRQQYGVSEVFGVPHGYMGFYSHEWVDLTLERVETIHREGGSILGSSRGGHDTTKICDALEERGVNVVFTIGGDGTAKGSEAIALELMRRQLRAVVAHVPKTIDNDIPLIDYSFGFGTAVQEATRAVYTARDEAVAYPDGVGLVNLMGRHSGFIAAHASIAARGVDACLVPEVPFTLEGERGLLRYIESTIAQKGHCVLVVAEGAGQQLLEDEAAALGVDASGNAKLAEIGPFLKRRINDYLAERGRTPSLKYVDPTYMVRATPATAADNILCLQLAHDAVHGALAGYTAFMAGRINGRSVYIPLRAANGKRNAIVPTGNFWQQLVFATGQPNWGQ